MALSGKDAARQLIDALPDDASLDDIVEALDSHKTENEDQQDLFRDQILAGQNNSRPAERRPVKKGYITVLEPTRPLPTVPVDLVNYIIEKMRREREDRFLGLSEDDG